VAKLKIEILYRAEQEAETSLLGRGSRAIRKAGCRIESYSWPWNWIGLR